MARLSLALALLVLFASAPAAADHGPRPLRTGPTFGVGVGAGNMFSNCDDEFDCGNVLESASVHAYAGGFLGSDTALIIEGWGMVHRDDRVTITHGMAAGALQQWLVPRLWFKGGVGIARSSFTYDAIVADIEDRRDIVPGALAALGLDVVRGTYAAFDLQLRYGAALSGDSEARIHQLALNAGLSWH